MTMLDLFSTHFRFSSSRLNFSRFNASHCCFVFYCFAFLSFVFLSMAGCQSATDSNVLQQQAREFKSPEQAAISGEKTPYYLDNLKLLKASDEVKPKTLDVHPVSAVYNREAIIPPMCYTRTEGKNNPCYVCHQDAIQGRENVMNDRDLQEAYTFSDLGKTNHWRNLFEDRKARVDSISDNEILEWIEQDNYSVLAERLQKADFKGWIPDLDNLHLAGEAFDHEGFAKDGSHWVAFNYKPFPSTFWPTNGSTDDVMIKLPEPYRNNENGEYSRDVYKANLAILEANIKGYSEITSLPIDETKVGVDLDGDNRLSVVKRVVNIESYVGQANHYYLTTHVYPEGTEFLHTVRYVGIGDADRIQPSTRMKEVRYMKKWKAYPKGTLARYYEEEAFAKEAGHLPGYTNLYDYGLDNGMGWSIQGFIENKDGHLRVASFEENLYCMGCHNSVGSTVDKVFSFARKVDGEKGWGYIDLEGMVDAPSYGEKQGEILTYFERVGGGDEFRSNQEMLERFFHEDGSVNYQAIAGKDVYDLITPSKSRALRLNKAYKAIVEEQDFLFGRDATVTPLTNVYDFVDDKTVPTLDEEVIFSWDIRLDWKTHQMNKNDEAERVGFFSITE